jgi:hypothetical protein
MAPTTDIGDPGAHRETIFRWLYEQGFTMEAIAAQLGVSQQQISKDLIDLQPSSKPPRPKGGRPKGGGGMPLAPPHRLQNRVGGGGTTENPPGAVHGFHEPPGTAARTG